MGLRPPYLQQQQRRLWQRVAPRCWARSSQHHQQQQQLLLQQPPGQGPLCPLPLQRQPGEQAVPPWLSAGRPRRRVVPRAGQSWRDIGEDLVEIGEDLLERATSALSGEKRAKRRGAQQGPGSSPGGGPGGGGSSDEGGAPGSGDGGGLRGPPPPPPTSKTWAEWSNAGGCCRRGFLAIGCLRVVAVANQWRRCLSGLRGRGGTCLSSSTSASWLAPADACL